MEKNSMGKRQPILKVVNELTRVCLKEPQQSQF